MEAKRALRRIVRDARRARTTEQRAIDATGLTAQLSELVRSSGARSVTCYVSDTHEPATEGFLLWAHENDVRVLLPIADGAGCCAGSMRSREWPSTGAPQVCPNPWPRSTLRSASPTPTSY